MTNWPELVRNVFNTLRPGGWYESQEHTVEISTDDGSVPEDNILNEWCGQLIAASDKIGKTCVVAPHIKGWMENAGLVNVVQHRFKLPIGTWPKDPLEKEIGAFNLVNMLDATEGYTMALYTRVLGVMHRIDISDPEMLILNRNRSMKLSLQLKVSNPTSEIVISTCISNCKLP